MRVYFHDRDALNVIIAEKVIEFFQEKHPDFVVDLVLDDGAKNLQEADIPAFLAAYDAIVIPLTLPGCLSLFIAEVLHTSRSPCLLILCSATNAPKEVGEQLFDHHLSSFELCGLGEILLAYSQNKSDLSRIQDEKVLRMRTKAILDAASCFGWQS